MPEGCTVSARVVTPPPPPFPPIARAWPHHFGRFFGRWDRWLPGCLDHIPGTDLYAANPVREGGDDPYRGVAGGTDMAATAGYWLDRSQPEDPISRPLGILSRLSPGNPLGREYPLRTPCRVRGAELSFADGWDADLFAVPMGIRRIDGLPSDQRKRDCLPVQSMFGVSRQVGGESPSGCPTSGYWSVPTSTVTSYRACWVSRGIRISIRPSDTSARPSLR